jgi:hypothetical protein
MLLIFTVRLSYDHTLAYILKASFQSWEYCIKFSSVQLRRISVTIMKIVSVIYYIGED